MKKFMFLLELVGTCFIVGYVNTNPVPHSSLWPYNVFAVLGIGYIMVQTIKAWTR